MRSPSPLIITGMHRSGTSLVAQAFHRSGLYVGDRLRPASAFNRDGYFEDEDIVRFHDDLLAEHGAAWHAVPRGPLAVLPAFRERAEALIETKFRDHPRWGFKDPRASLFCEFWRTVLPASRWVFVYREPSEVAASLFRRGDPLLHTANRLLAVWLALGLWARYNREIVGFARRYPAECVLVRIPEDVQPRSEARLNRLVRRAWSLPLDDVSLGSVYKPDLLRRRSRWWMRALSLDPRARAILRSLDRLHDRLLAASPGDGGV